MENVITENVKGFDIKLQAIPGVFSKRVIDSGSKLLIEKMKIEKDAMVADLGCGSGIIGIVAAKLNPQGHVHLLDVNLRMVKLAQVNAQLNELKNVKVFISDLFSAVEDRTYHQIVSNPPLHLGKEFLEEAATECYKHLKNEGTVLWVVQKHLKSVIERIFEKYFDSYQIIASGEKHIVLKAQKNKMSN